MSFLKRILGLGPKANFAKLVNEGALILDVRTIGEYSSGHINGSMNITLNKLKDRLHQLPHKDKCIITCCASGMRSAAAEGLLKSYGYAHVYNGGSWRELQKTIQ